ncbi:MAG: glycosyltransferase family 4 protein [Bacteroidaceae bacterium]|nr:glycosyltransferase family 4 protein [Bacteroidaceae bacterium]
MKKICAISTVEGTMNSFIIPAMRIMKEHGYDVTLVCNMSEEFYKKNSEEFHCINIPMKRGASLTDLIKMPFVFRRLFKRCRFDYVQYATPNASLYAALGAKMAKVPKRVYCQWGIRYVGNEGVMRRLLKFFEKISCMCSTHIRPASWKNLDFAVEEGLYEREKAAAIGDGGTIGIDLKQFDIEKKGPSRVEVLEQFPQLKNKLVFGFVGRINKDKGIGELLEAFIRVESKYENAALLLIGGMDGDSSLYTQYFAKHPNIISMGRTNEVPKYISAIDVLVHPSYREGFSMVIQQAMAMEIPVVTTNIPGPSEVIEKDVTGVLAEPRDVDTLYEAMAWMVEHPEQRVAMGKAGRVRCEKHFTRERMLQLTLEDRESIINS